MSRMNNDQMPNLDALAADGTLFTESYCPSPVCGPARAGMKTGKYPAATGMVKNLRPLNEGLQYLPALLRDAGYETGLAGKLHLAPADRDFGFDVRHLSDAPYSVYGKEDEYSEYIGWLREKFFDAQGRDPVTIFDRDELAYDDNLKLFMMGSCFRSEEEHETKWTTDMTVDFLEKGIRRNHFSVTPLISDRISHMVCRSLTQAITSRRTLNCRQLIIKISTKNRFCSESPAEMCMIMSESP